MTYTHATTVIQTRIAQEDKKMADSICEQLGLSLNDALRIFVRNIINTRSIPLNLSLSKTNEREPDAEE